MEVLDRLRALSQRVLARAADRRVLVVGDVMVDRWVNGEFVKESGELSGRPCPVIRCPNPQYALGGAANAAANLAALGVRTTLVGAIAKDPMGDWMIGACEASDIEFWPARAPLTVTKTRVIVADGMALRYDVESGYGDGLDVPFLESRVAHAMRSSGAQVAVFSDYGKGTLRRSVIEQMCELPLLVDQKGDDWSVYDGATVIKANSQESLEHDKFVERGGVDVRSCKTYKVVTNGAHGMCIELNRNEWVRVGGLPVPVCNTVGAGDSAMAGLAAAWACGLEPRECVEFANVVAAASVMLPGTAAVRPADIAAALGAYGR